MSTQDYLIALGSNLGSASGNPKVTLGKALSLLQSGGTVIRHASPIFRTPAFPPGSGPDFANAAASVRSSLAPAALLERLHEVEQQLGRTRSERWGPRSLDLDLLACGDLVLPDRSVIERWMTMLPDRQMTQSPDELLLPHPRLHERAFVLCPLRTIAPGWTHPLLLKTVEEMCDELSAEAVAEVRIYA